MEASMDVTTLSRNVEEGRLAGDLELLENAGCNKVLQTLDGPKDVSSDCTVEASMEKDYCLMMGFVDDYVCAFCDEGGRLISCEGNCGRYFHPTKTDGEHSRCETLGLREEQVKPLVFVCKNCEYKNHPCVVCGNLGSSDSSDLENIEVWQCNKKGCKRFYHVECLDKDFNKRPEDFECPLHECWSCKNKGRKATPEAVTIRGRGIKVRGMHLVQCRRCPKAYHQKCLPRKISSRKWETDDRILFYCKDHKMVQSLRSATRDHLKFPEIGVEDGTSLEGASKKRSVPEGQVDHANKESDPLSEKRDKIPRTGSGAMESFAPK